MFVSCIFNLGVKLECAIFLILLFVPVTSVRFGSGTLDVGKSMFDLTAAVGRALYGHLEPAVVKSNWAIPHVVKMPAAHAFRGISSLR